MCNGSLYIFFLYLRSLRFLCDGCWWEQNAAAAVKRFVFYIFLSSKYAMKLVDFCGIYLVNAPVVLKVQEQPALNEMIWDFFCGLLTEQSDVVFFEIGFND